MLLYKLLSWWYTRIIYECGGWGTSTDNLHLHLHLHALIFTRLGYKYDSGHNSNLPYPQAGVRQSPVSRTTVWTVALSLQKAAPLFFVGCSQDQGTYLHLVSWLFLLVLGKK